MASVYKYRGFGDPNSDTRRHSERLITHREIYFAPPNELNDPFDCFPNVVWPWNGEDEIAAVEEIFADELGMIPDPVDRNRVLHSLIDDMRDPVRRCKNLYDAISDGTGICSLSKNCDSVQQWAYYADGQKGFCVGLRYVEDGSGVFGKIGDSLLDVRYDHKEPPPIDFLKGLRDSSARVSMLIDAVTAKSQAWSHEQEIRSLSDGSAVRTIPHDQFDVVYLGPKATEVELELIRGWMKEGELASVPVRKMVPAVGSWELHAEECN